MRVFGLAGRVCRGSCAEVWGTGSFYEHQSVQQQASAPARQRLEVTVDRPTSGDVASSCSAASFEQLLA